MKRTVARILILGALVGGLGLLIAGKLVSETTGKEAKKKKKSRATLVTTYEVQPETIVDTYSAVGSLRAAESIAVKNEVPGKVVGIEFEEGDRVDQGQTLLRMRSETLRAELEVKRSRRDLLQTQVERQRKVLEKGGISQQQFDVTENELEVLEAEIQQVRAELNKTTLRAPFDGRIGLRDVSPGAILTQGTTVAELVQTDPIEIEFTVPERYAAKVGDDTEVRFRVHGSEKIRAASLHAVESQLDEETRALRVRARTDNADGEFRPGQYAQVRVPLDRIEGALAVPVPALVESANETVIWVNAGGEAERREVETGVRTEGRVQITDGLSAGDEVVTTGRQTLEPGATLEIDDSEDAMDVEAIGPDPSRTGMRNDWFSEETLGEEEDDANSTGEGEREAE
jgi:membrane fusion protein (multidrug efflux system)